MNRSFTTLFWLTIYLCLFCLLYRNTTKVGEFGRYVNDTTNDYSLEETKHRRANRIKRQEARVAMNEVVYDSCRLYSIKNVSDVFDILTLPTGYCKRLVSLGGGTFHCTYGDGSKRVCLDERFWSSEDDCLVYSFGLGDDVSFEVALNRFKPSCEIHMFDPSVREKNVSDSIQLNDHVVFHQYGIYSKNIVYHVEKSKSEVEKHKLCTLDTFLYTLNHTNRTLDYLKMDVEQIEWPALEQMLRHPSKPLSKVRQLALELHFNGFLKTPNPDTWLSVMQEKLDFLLRFESETGFRRISYDRNFFNACALFIPQENRKISLCGEILYIRPN